MRKKNLNFLIIFLCITGCNEKRISDINITLNDLELAMTPPVELIKDDFDSCEIRYSAKRTILIKGEPQKRFHLPCRKQYDDALFDPESNNLVTIVSDVKNKNVSGIGDPNEIIVYNLLKEDTILYARFTSMKYKIHLLDVGHEKILISKWAGSGSENCLKKNAGLIEIRMDGSCNELIGEFVNGANIIGDDSIIAISKKKVMLGQVSNGLSTIYEAVWPHEMGLSWSHSSSFFVANVVKNKALWKGFHHTDTLVIFRGEVYNR